MDAGHAAGVDSGLAGEPLTMQEQDEWAWLLVPQDEVPC